MILVSYHGASIMVLTICLFWWYLYRIMGLVSWYLTICPKVQFPKKMIALTYFKTIFMTQGSKCYWNTLITYYMTNKALLRKNEPLRWFWTWFPRVLKRSSCNLCMKIVSWYVSYHALHIVICIVSLGVTALANCVDPDQLASSEANWSGSALFAIEHVN